MLDSLVFQIPQTENKPAQRYMKCLADRFQLKFREGKTKRKKPTALLEN